MNDDPLRLLGDTLWRRELTPAEEREVAEHLGRHPDLAESWREEAALARAMRRLPSAPTPSNFTARVLDQIRHETPRPGRTAARRPTLSGWGLVWRWLAPATTAFVLAGALWLGHESEQRHERLAAAHQQTALRALAGLSPEVLQDFDVIRTLGDGPAPVDYELLAALE